MSNEYNYREQLPSGLYQKYKIVKVGEPYADPSNTPCPECGAPTLTPGGGGVKCSKCSWWFCY
jgi:tRNA(Ile2) C34 agmatinyltransferase TiaS